MATAPADVAWTRPTPTCGGQGLDLRAPAVAPYGMKQLYVTDPDGYHRCFQWPADGRG